MKITCYVLSVLLASAMFSAHGTSQATKSPISAEERGMFGMHRLWSKGGIGMINKHLYIVVRSAENERNELVVKPTEETEERLHGYSVTEAEVAILY